MVSGLLDDSERDDLAKMMIDAVWQMGPRNNCEGEWFAWLLNELGIELPQPPEQEDGGK
jgi:hypothetical protein